MTNLNLTSELRVQGVVVATQPVPDSTVVINSESDFPTASGGVITFEDDIHYVIGASFSTANRFVLGARNVITMGSLTGPTT